MLAGWWLVLLGGCAPAPGPQGPSRAPRPVALVTVGTQNLPRKAAVTGVLAAQEELVLGLEVAGRVQSLAVDVGDVVAVDTVVAALAPREFELAVARTEAAVIAAQARLGVAKDGDLDAVDVEAIPAVTEAKAILREATLQRDRVASMVQEKMTPASELDGAAASLAVAESRLQRARDEVRTWLAEARLRRVEHLQAEKRLADSRVKAPWTGRIAARHAAPGQVLSAGAPVVTLLRIDPLRLRLRVPDRLAAETAIGQTVEFTVDGSNSPPRTGRIVRAGPAIDRLDRTRLLEAEVANADGALLPGGFCRAQIVIAEAEPVVVVNKASVVTFAGVHRVFTVGDGKAGGKVAKGSIVEVGRDLGDRVEIVRGIAAGASIVAEAAGLSPELPVAVGS